MNENENEKQLENILAGREERGQFNQSGENLYLDPTEEAISKHGLGSVNMDRFGPEKASSSDLHLGWHLINMQDLPSRGRFYPNDMEIKIRSAKVAEIRHFSTMDENNILDIDEKLNSIVQSCTSVTASSNRVSFKDICEEDRFFIILSIRDLTFPEPENALKVNFTAPSGNKYDIEIKRDYFRFFEIPGEIEKYYSESARGFVIKTRSYGDIFMRPPSIGIMQEVTKYIKERQERGINIDQSLIQIIPFISNDWRSFNQKKIFDMEVDMNGWDNKKYTLIYRLAEKMKVGIQPEMQVMVEDEETSVPINFRDGIKSIFVIQDFSGELL
jgi:hypothetical protein